MLKRNLIEKFVRLNRVPEGDEGGDAGGDKGAGAGGAGDSGGDKGDKDLTKDFVSRADHERALADLNKFKKAASELAKREKDLETSRMKEQNQHKELAERYEAEAKEANEKAERIQNSYLSERKFNALRAKCSELGLRPEALSDLEMLDLGDIEIETTSTGKINVLGADKFATQLKTRKPHWFSDKAAPKVNTNGTRVLDSGDAITPKDLLKAEAKGRKAGDMSEYYEMHKKFQQQRLASR